VQLCDTLRLDWTCLSEKDLVRLAAALATGRSSKSVSGVISGFDHMVQARGYGALPRGEDVGCFLTGLRKLFREIDVPRQQEAFTVDELRSMVAGVDPARPFDAITALMFIIAFFLGCRVEDYSDGRLKWRDVCLLADGSVSVRLHAGKTSDGQDFRSIAPRSDVLDPGSWLHCVKWGLPAAQTLPESPLLLQPHKKKGVMSWKQMSGKTALALVRYWADQSIEDAADRYFGTHSMRAGCAIALLDARTVSDAQASFHMRWSKKSDMLAYYYRALSRARADVTAAIV